MPPTIPTREPASIRAGDLVEWTKELPDYPANDSWVLTYTLLHPTLSKITITAVALGSLHKVSVPAGTSAAYATGQYEWVARVAKAAEVYTLETGLIRILPNPATVTTHDFRTHARRMLEALQAAYEGNASSQQLEYEINGRRIRTMGADELIKWFNFYSSKIADEDAAAQIEKTGIDPRRIGIRFQRV